MSITAKQWQFILMNMLGLRSGATEDDIKSAASYAMDTGKTAGIPFPPIPENWDGLLAGTITHMKEFEGSDNRYLLVVSKSSGGSFEYQGCFPKCSVKPTKVWASTKLDASVEELTKWVVDNIPDGT
jgi:hypothetical protein